MQNHHSKKRISTLLSVSLTLLMSATLVHAQVQEEQSEDDKLLEQRVLSETPKVQSLIPAKTFSMSQALVELKKFHRAAAQTPKCADSSKTLFARKYVLTRDSAGKPCRIYDLSFPNLKTLLSAKKTLQVPVQKLKSRDYLNWLDGNYSAIEQSREQFRQRFNPLQVAKESWIAKLKFRIKPSAIPGSQASLLENGLPRSFRIADLDIGQYRFDAQTQNEIQGFLSELQNYRSTSPEAATEAEYMTKVLKTPESFLQGIRFDWNELEKVYDVVLDGDFLPFAGPVILVDYQTQYKYAVEKLFRSILSSGIQSLSRFIPNKMIANSVETLVTDAFEQIEMAYSYQMLQLEDTLRTASLGRSDIGINAEDTGRAFNILHGQRTDLFTTYILAVAQGKPFDWTAFETMGKASRYNVEKQRDILMSKQNSKLVLDKKCQTEFVKDYFAVCTIGGKKDAIYSLISDQTVINKSFGPPLLYRYQRPYEASLRRGGTWALSLALRIFGVNIARQAVVQLEPVLKGFMNSGILDEALMRNSFSTQQRSGTALNAEESQLLQWLYIQNLNPFLPKSMISEDNVIAANKKLIGVN